MPYRKFLLTFLSLVLVVNYASGQENDEHHSETHSTNSHEDTGHAIHKKHVISASINHTIIFGGATETGESTSITLPSFGLNYTYFFNEKWAIGLHNDIILEDFFVKEESSTFSRSSSDGGEVAVIERGTPIAACIMGIYKPLPFLGLMAGLGREFSSHEDFTVIRFGIEVPYHLPKNWEVFGVLTYDININAYQSLTYGIGLGKLF